jgi:hypothetical protein
MYKRYGVPGRGVVPKDWYLDRIKQRIKQGKVQEKQWNAT